MRGRLALEISAEPLRLLFSPAGHDTRVAIVMWRLSLLAGLSLTLLLQGSGCTTLSYPQSPQWHGKRFENPPQWPLFPTVTDFFRWQSSRPERVAKFTPRVVHNSAKLLRQDRERLSITWIGHATLLVQGGGVAVLTDPIFSRRIGGLFGRLAPPGVALAELPPIDVVVISHNHRDHLDEASIKALGKGVLYLVPLGLGPWFRARGMLRVIELDWWQTTQVTTVAGRTATVTLVPAQHWSWRGPCDERKSLWGGYLLDLAGKRVYFAGDTGYPAAFREIGQRFPGIDYALLPIGAYAPRWFMKPQHMAPEQAARAFLELGARALVPMHYATFRLADEPMDEPPRLLREALVQQSGSDDHLIELAIGETTWNAPG